MANVEPGPNGQLLYVVEIFTKGLRLLLPSAEKILQIPHRVCAQRFRWVATVNAVLEADEYLHEGPFVLLAEPLLGYLLAQLGLEADYDVNEVVFRRFLEKGHESHFDFILRTTLLTFSIMGEDLTIDGCAGQPISCL